MGKKSQAVDAGGSAAREGGRDACGGRGARIVVATLVDLPHLASDIGDDWRPGWHNYGAGAGGNSDGFATGRQHGTVNNPAASLGDRDRSAPASEESENGQMLVQHGIRPVVTAVTSGSAFLRTALPIALYQRMAKRSPTTHSNPQTSNDRRFSDKREAAPGSRIETVGGSSFYETSDPLLGRRTKSSVCCLPRGMAWFLPRWTNSSFPISPASVVCGFGAVSARVAPVPHLARYDWAFF